MDIVLIAPFKGLKDIADDVVKGKNLPVDVVLGDLSDGVKVAHEAVRNGAEVIISRGGTYQMIKDTVNVPVVEIPVNAFDMLRALKDSLGTNAVIGAVGYANIVYDVDTLADILNLNIFKVIFNDERKAPQQVYKAAKSGIKKFVGDTIGIRTVNKMGLSGNLITSGKESILQAVDEAVRVLQVKRQEKARAEQFKVIIDFVHDGIISVDSNEHITIFNRMAENIFKKPRNEMFDKNISSVIENTGLPEVLKTTKPQFNELQQVGDFKIVTNRIPIVVDGKVYGAVATFQRVSQIQKTEQKIRRKLHKKGLVAKYHFVDIVYKSKVMEQVMEQARKYAKWDSTVLILGETGTGKELIAQSIHNESLHSSGPFVAINCAALPENLLESELFGYVDGAFTGARKGGKLGLFEMAHQGTIFLDEIGDMPLYLQSRLLRVIQEKEVMRIGDDKVIPIDVRIIASTNKNLKENVEKGKFREDLYYRLNVLSLYLPPLRDRKQDIKVLAEYFLRKYEKKMSMNLMQITEEAFSALNMYDYPGNVRELEGIIKRAITLSDGKTIDVCDIKYVRKVRRDNKKQPAVNDVTTIKDNELKLVESALKLTGNNKTKAAKLLGIDRTTLWRKLKEVNK